MIKKLLFSAAATLLVGLVHASEPVPSPAVLSAKSAAVFHAAPGRENGVPPAQAVATQKAVVREVRAEPASKTGNSKAKTTVAARAAQLDTDPDVNGMPGIVLPLPSETTLREAAAAAQRDSDPRLNGTAAEVSRPAGAAHAEAFGTTDLRRD